MLKKNIRKLLETTVVFSLLSIFFCCSECTADLRDPDYLTPTTKELVQKSNLICKGEVLQVSTVGDTEEIQKFIRGYSLAVKYTVLSASYKCDQVLKGDKSNKGKIITVKFPRVDSSWVVVDSFGCAHLPESLSKGEYLLLFLARNGADYVLTYPNFSLSHKGSKRFISKDSLEAQGKGEDPVVVSVRELISAEGSESSSDKPFRTEESDKSVSAEPFEFLAYLPTRDLYARKQVSDYFRFYNEELFQSLLKRRIVRFQQPSDK